MYDAKKLTASATPIGPEGAMRSRQACLADFTDELAEQLRNEAREREAKRNKGFKSFGDAIGVATAELAKVSAALRKTVPAEPVQCRAINQLGARCMRTDVHESHTFPPTEPDARTAAIVKAGTDPAYAQQVIKEMTDPSSFNLAELNLNTVYDGEGGPFVVTVKPGTDGELFAMAVCGVADKYGSDGESRVPDRCAKPPHGPETGHEGFWSRWPWQGERPAPAPVKVPRESAMAYLRGEVDELGTKPLFVEARGTVEVTGTVVDETGIHITGVVRNPDDAAKITAGVLTGYSVGVNPTPPSPIDCECPRDQKVYCQSLRCQGGADLQEATVQPDPFDNALPDEPVRKGVWTGGAMPVEPDPRPLWLAQPDGWDHDRLPLPRSIRTTQVRMGEQCGMAYRLVSRDQVPEVPSWANIGGTGLHEAARLIEQGIISGTHQPVTLTEESARGLWKISFAKAIAETEAETPFPRATWRAADKGAEGEDWWNNAGPLMVRDYSAWSASMHADGWSILTVESPQRPPTREYFPPVVAMELEMHTPLLNGEITGHLDQAWYRILEGDEIEIRVIDLKSGSRMPDDDWQLQAYPWELIQRLMADGMPVDRFTWSAAYYDARNGKLCDIVTPRMNSAEITYRAGSVLRMHEANNYPANPGSDWKSPCYVCAVRYACPIMALKS